MPKGMFDNYIEEHTERFETGYRGGGIEITLDDYLDTDCGYKMSAYQNYLGGGMTGKIKSDINFKLDELSENKQVAVEKMAESLKRYFYSLNNGGGGADEFASSDSYEEQQSRVGSYY